MTTDTMVPMPAVARGDGLSRHERRLHAQAAKALSGADLLAVLDAIPVRLMLCDSTSTIRHLNRTARVELAALVAPLGLTADDLLGMPVDVLQRTQGYVDVGLRTLPFTFQVDNGQDIVDVTVSEIRDRMSVVGTLTAWTSAGGRVRTEAVLREVNAENAAFDQVLTGLSRARDLTEIGRYVSAAVIERLGWSRSDLWIVGGPRDQLRHDGGPETEAAPGHTDNLGRTAHDLVSRAVRSRDVELLVTSSGEELAAPYNQANVSACALPMVVGESVVAVVVAQAAHPLDVREQRRDALRNLARLASLAAEHLASEEAARHAAVNVSVTADVLTGLVSAITRDEVATTILTAVRSRFNWSYGSYWEPDADLARMVHRLDCGENGVLASVSRHQSFAPGEGIIGRAWKDEAMVVIDDFAKVGSYQEGGRRARVGDAQRRLGADPRAGVGRRRI